MKGRFLIVFLYKRNSKLFKSIHRIRKFEMSSQLFFMKLELLVRPAMLSLKDFHPIKGMSAYDVRGLILR